jgi:hypothetical protein
MALCSPSTRPRAASRGLPAARSTTVSTGRYNESRVAGQGFSTLERCEGAPSPEAHLFSTGFPQDDPASATYRPSQRARLRVVTTKKLYESLGKKPFQNYSKYVITLCGTGVPRTRPLPRKAALS